jgi:hypothetical protein
MTTTNNQTTEPTKKVSTSERTHARNLENIHIINGIIPSLGSIYDSKNELLKAAAMSDFEAGFAARMQAVNEAFSAEQNAVDLQIAEFKKVPNRVSKTIKAAKGLGLNVDFLENLQSTAYRLSGVRINKKTPDELQSGSSHSVSRRSYAGVLESLDLFDEQLKSNPNYDLNEAQYKSAIISAWVTSLRDIHNAALAAKLNTATTRNDRDQFGYSQTEGFIVRTTALKAYLETILEKNDPRLKQIKKMRFADYGK